MSSVSHCWSKEHTLQWGLVWKSLGQALNCDSENTLLEVWIAHLSVGVAVLSVKAPEEMTFLSISILVLSHVQVLPGFFISIYDEKL